MRKAIEYIFKEDIKKLFNGFSDLLDIRISFCSFEKSESFDFTEYPIGHNRPKCVFCKIIQEQLGLFQECVESDRTHVEESRKTGGLVAYKCHAGMTEAIIPISTSEIVIGFVMIGEIRHSEVLPEQIKQKCPTKKLAKQLKKAYKQTKCYKEKDINAIMNLFSSMIKHVIEEKLISTKTQNAIDPLLDYLEENPHIDLSLSDAAELLFCSVSSLTQLFKKATGQTFKQYQIKLKLEKVDEIFEDHPELSISEVAQKFGFNDPLYFSRIYSKHRGFPPSQKKHNNKAILRNSNESKQSK